MKIIKLSLATAGLVTAISLVVPVIPAKATEFQDQGLQEKEKGQKGQAFAGKVEGVDLTQKTLTVEGKVIAITDETKLTRKDAAIKLGDIKVGDEVHGLARLSASGQTEAISLKVGPKEKEKAA